MEESYRPETPPESELTRSNSGASSLTVTSSNDTLLHSGNATSDKYTGWTNEKHNTFLDCLEASFVKQLHRSMVLRAGCVEVNKSCRKLPERLSAHVNTASEFPVLHDGCWKQMDTVREPPVVYIEADSHDCLNNLCSDERHNILDIQLCCKPHCKEKRARERRSSSNVHETRSHLILSKPAETVGRLTEGSGQNYVDKDSEENSSCKKMKTAMVDTAEQEQVVPTRKLGRSGVANFMFQINDQVNLGSSSDN